MLVLYLSNMDLCERSLQHRGRVSCEGSGDLGKLFWVIVGHVEEVVLSVLVLDHG